MEEAMSAPEEEIMTLEEYERLREESVHTYRESQSDVDASELFEDAIEWLRRNYSDYRFFAERDIVWTVQTRINTEIESRNLPFRVFNDYTLFGRTRADLVIFSNEAVEVAAEFKYEPTHRRNANCGGDIPKGKFPVVFWAEVEKDLERAKDYAASGYSKAAYSILVDEGNHFRHRNAPASSEWIDWTENMSISWSRQEA